MNKEEFKNEKDFFSTIKNIKRHRREDEADLYKEMVNVINNTPGDTDKKELIIKLINSLDKDIDKLNPLVFVSEINVLFTKLILIAKSKYNNVPSEILIPMLNLKEDSDGWIANMKDGIIPYLLNSNIFKIINIKDK